MWEHLTRTSHHQDATLEDLGTALVAVIVIVAQSPDTVATATAVALAATDAGMTDMEVAEAATAIGHMSGTASVARAGADPGALCRQVVDMVTTREVAVTAGIIKAKKGSSTTPNKITPVLPHSFPSSFSNGFLCMLLQPTTKSSSRSGP